jgi:hypothetical protein
MHAVDLADGADAVRHPGPALSGAHAYPAPRGGDVSVGEARRYARHHGGRGFDADETAIVEPVDPIHAYAAAEQGMPTIRNDGMLPDMGRMDG